MQILNNADPGETVTFEHYWPYPITVVYLSGLVQLRCGPCPPVHGDILGRY